MTATTLSTIPKLVSQVLAIYEVAPEEIFHQADIELNATATVENRVSMDKMVDEYSELDEKRKNLGNVTVDSDVMVKTMYNDIIEKQQGIQQTMKDRGLFKLQVTEP